ncbi:MAG: DNA-directed RNA polymerase subunit beta' [Planctomycetes bacterium]|nr:DNA-directed RNA polymerase subunit beta' [Planctomycetota bacterium]
MLEVDVFHRVHDYACVTVKLASPEDIRSWSFGEVKKPETINYRTYRPEKDGLFCEKIFGPTRDWECFCGKYKGIKHRNIVCDRCGVQVTHSKVRRKRLGHINLAAPVAHIWFFKATPSRIGNLLDIKVSSLDKVVYFQEYIVIDGGTTPLKRGQMLSEDEYRQARQLYGDKFESDMGAEAVRKMLMKLELTKISLELREELKNTRSKQRKKDIIKRLKTVEQLRDSPNKPEWMILDVVPVIPPDLRPLVLLESGNFATSDLNDLYRRLINRNNRLKKLLDLNAPEVIIRNEKRMLQQSVDALFDNGRCRRPVLGTSNRPLKSLTDMIKGKQGRFRENLLGKRVDYSARSVIVVGPELKLHQCGLPKKIALELFQPFIIRRLKELGYADTIKSAKKMLDRKEPEVWDILEEVIKSHPVLLNRAPTLHRMGIQAFEPVLVEGNAIKIHPLVCTGYNADFDGDQMAVHLPLSYEAQVEAAALMMAPNNIFSPAHGRPIISPTQDIVLGCYYLTVDRPQEKGEGKAFRDAFEALRAYADKKVTLHARIKVRIGPGRVVRTKEGDKPSDGLVETTVGRLVLNDMLPNKDVYFNVTLDKKGIARLIEDVYKRTGQESTVDLLDRLKELGFKSATLAGLSFAIADLSVPREKDKVLGEADKRVETIEKQLANGVITDGERYNQIVDVWTHAREKIGAEMMRGLKDDTRAGKPYLNPIFVMVDSGARGSVEQIRQLAGMRGLMAKPNGRIIETPIRANFREGLRVLEYFSSTHGARKGLADTALKTADSGYLTRKLADVAQNVVVTQHDCRTISGIAKSPIYKGDRLEVPLWELIRGRVSRDSITDVVTDEVVVKDGELITEEIAKQIEKLGYPKVRVRSALTCESTLGVCQLCYGMDLSRGQLVELGLAVGIIGAQSIGEPGTQLTMRTFHIGGVASRELTVSEVKARREGIVRFSQLRAVVNAAGERVVLDRQGELILENAKGLEIDRYSVPLGGLILVKDGQEVKAGSPLASWDPNHTPILSDREGVVRYKDVIDGKTVKVETDANGNKRRMVIEHKGDLHPEILIEDKKGVLLDSHPLPERAYIMAEDGDKVSIGDLLAKKPKDAADVQDITGGLPRVTEIFEARKPKEPAVMAEIDGIVELAKELKRGKRTILVKPEAENVPPMEHLVPHGRHLLVRSGDRVRAGDALIEGPLVPQDLLRIKGEDELQIYLLREVQAVYRSQGVSMDDKHIEVIIAQMLRKVRIEDPGDTDFLPGAMVDRHVFRITNERMRKERKKGASAEPVLLGITKAALQSDSLISAASFQETTKVLTEAAMAGKRDELVGLKENVILGNLVPTGTGFKHYHQSRVKLHGETIELPSDEAEVGDEDAETAGAGKLS